MKLRNKKTGEIAHPDRQFWEDSLKLVCEDTNKTYVVKTIAELNEEWEDYEEEPYIIDMWEENCICDVEFGTELGGTERAKECGLYFETKEEAEKAVEKLKAWKRLKDRNFKVDLWDYDGSDGQGRIRTGRILFRVKDYEENDKDLDLLFGGEE